VCLLPEFLIAALVQRAVLLRRHVAADHRGRDDGLHGAGAGYVMSQQYESLLKKANFKGFGAAS
jgi:hypothetical protein